MVEEKTLAKVSSEQKDVELQNFMGRHIDDPELQVFICQIEEEPEAFNLTLEGPDKEVIRLLELGLQISLDRKKKINNIFVFADGVQGYKEYPYTLPNGLSFKKSRDEAISLLGQPTKMGGPVEGALDREIFYWDRWDSEAFSLHLRYPKDKKSILMLTLIRPDRLPDEER